jgi:KDO2-lipid IV(A) lauroyltransferase
MTLRSITNSQYSLRLVMAILRALPLGASQRFGRFAADIMTRMRNSSITRCVRVNQWVVHGRKSTASELDGYVREVFYHAAECYVDLFRHMHDPDAVERLVKFSPRAYSLLEYSQQGESGMVVVGAHMSNFDLVMRAIAFKGVRALALSYALPPSGYELQNEMRLQTGIEITPIDRASLRKAHKRLLEGGMVFTGVDRPVPGNLQPLPFYGAPAQLPTGHIRMALNANVPVLVLSSRQLEDGTYYVDTSELIPMKAYPNRSIAVRRNAVEVLGIVADFIRQEPTQWLMYFPVWPDLMGKAP